MIHGYILQKTCCESSGWSILVDSNGGLEIRFYKNETDVAYSVKGLGEFIHLRTIVIC